MNGAMEHRLRALKALTWRIVGTLDTIFLSWIITGRLDFAVSIGGIELLTKFVLYYAHDWVWQGLSVQFPHWVQLERPGVSALKSVSWRLTGSLDTLLLSYLVTGNLSAALGIGSAELMSKMVLYFFHERAWLKVRPAHLRWMRLRF